MLVMDSNDRFFKTGLKIDWAPKMCNVNSERIEDGVRQLAAGKSHYTILDNKNKLHVYGSQTILKEKAEDEFDHDGFKVFQGEDIFDDGQVLDLQMKYEVLGALVKN